VAWMAVSEEFLVRNDAIAQACCERLPILF
jgi:hypothetical protein